MITFKKSRIATEISYWTKKVIYTSQSRARISKLSVHDHMMYVVKIDILTGQEKTGNLHFILKIIFHLLFIEKPCIFFKTCTVNYESIAYCAMKLC